MRDTEPSSPRCLALARRLHDCQAVTLRMRLRVADCRRASRPHGEFAPSFGRPVSMKRADRRRPTTRVAPTKIDVIGIGALSQQSKIKRLRIVSFEERGCCPQGDGRVSRTMRGRLVGPARRRQPLDFTPRPHRAVEEKVAKPVDHQGKTRGKSGAEASANLRSGGAKPETVVMLFPVCSCA